MLTPPIAGRSYRVPSWVATAAGHVILRMMNYPGRQFVGEPGRWRFRERGGRRFVVHASDRAHLDAWYLPPLGRSRRATVVMLHGWMEFKEMHLAQALRLQARGHPVVLYDARGHGTSAGRPATFGVRERSDLSCVIDAAQARGYVGDAVVTLGFSMGAATVLQHAADDPRVVGVIAMAPFVDFVSAVDSFRQLWADWIEPVWLQAGFERAARQCGFEMADASTVAAVRRLDRPMLLIEGGRDGNLPPQTHCRPLVEAKTCGPVEVVRIPEATHSLLARRAWPVRDQAIDRFVEGLPAAAADAVSPR